MVQQGGNEISANCQPDLDLGEYGVRSPEERDSVCWHPAELALVYAVLHLEECGYRNKSKSAVYNV